MEKEKKTTWIILENGSTFKGESFFYSKTACYGEVVFTTGMTGYQEALTDPSYRGQILVFTYPLLGNYGIFKHKYYESSKIQVKGVVLSEDFRDLKNSQEVLSLFSWLKKNDIPLLCGVDTRALTKSLRSEGSQRGAITKEPKLVTFLPVEKNPVKKASIKHPKEFGQGDKKVILIDCGSKDQIRNQLLKRNIKVLQVPFDYDFTHENFDGVMVSNGPGDPCELKKTQAIIKKILTKNIPIFGVCLGAQLLALSAGAKTYKLKFGHRSHNHPCINLKTGRCFITSQNHGYAIKADTLPPDFVVSYKSLNDNSVEGIEHKTKPIKALQFHPEASPGPLDCINFFDDFALLL